MGANDAGNRPGRRRAVAAAGIGNAVEWYDYSLYGALAPLIGAAFFASGSPAGDLVAAFAVFAAALIVRPIGVLVVGPLGDRFGRRWVLSSTVLAMSLATAAIGVLPGRDALGVAAPALLVAFRMVQGLSSGGEIGGGIAYLVEYAPANRRGLFGAWYLATLALGVAAGVGAAAGLAWLMPASAFEAWGWRLPFLLALPAGLVGLYLRLRLAEPPPFREPAPRATVWASITHTLGRHRGGTVRGLGMAAVVSLGLNTYFIFLPAHLEATDRTSLSRALTAAVVGLAACAATALAAGWISDRVGRRPLIMVGGLALAIGAIPSMALVRNEGLPPVVVFVAAGVALGCFVVPTIASEMFPTPIRATALSLTMGLAAAVFGGTAPLVHAMLVDRLSNLAPGIYVAAAAVAALVAVARTRETAFDPLP